MIISIVIVALAVFFSANLVKGSNQKFGYEGLGPNRTKIEGYIKGSWFVCSNHGIADSITVYIECTEDKKLKCAIYTYVANDDAGALIGETEELIINAGYEGWKTFNLSSPKPSLSENTKYFLVAFGEKKGGLSYIYWSATDAIAKAIRLYINYNNFPNTLIGETGVNMKHRIYCTYISSAPPSPLCPLPLLPIMMLLFFVFIFWIFVIILARVKEGNLIEFVVDLFIIMIIVAIVFSLIF